MVAASPLCDRFGTTEPAHLKRPPARRKSGERIMWGTVERRLSGLAGHPPGHCPLCTVAFVECCILDRAVEYLGHAIDCGGFD